MKLREYQGHELFTRYGLPTAGGILVTSPGEAASAAERIGGPTVVLKAQLSVGGRGKHGGIRFADTREEVIHVARQLLNSEFLGEKVEELLVQQALPVAAEYYLAIAVARECKGIVLLASRRGGMEIEEQARQGPEQFMKWYVDPGVGLRSFHVRAVASYLCDDAGTRAPLCDIIARLWKVFWENDCYLAEINPLVLTSEGQLVAVDAKIILDDNALFRHEEYASLHDCPTGDACAAKALQWGLSYVKLDGNIGCIVNGAGLALATLDCIRSHGIQPANFLDIGGGATAAKMEQAIDVVLLDRRVTAVLVNIFGGITRCNLVAEGLQNAISRRSPKVPFAVRLSGTGAAEARMQLRDIKGTRVLVAESMEEAGRKIAEMVLP
jgi:succinyl-CoA synthetase beta subunit